MQCIGKPFLAPIKNSNKCQKCHGDEDSLRGVLKLTSSMEAVRQKIVQIRLESLLVMLIVMLFTLFMVMFTIQFSIARPLGKVVKAIIGGDERNKLPITGEDEFSNMKNNFDFMLDKIDQATRELKLQTKAMEASANSIVITDKKGCIQWVNPAFCKNTGYSLNEVMGQNPEIIKSDKHDEHFYHDVWTTIISGTVWDGVFINKRKDGSLFYDKTTITPVIDKDNNITNFIAIKEDITRQVQADKEMEHVEEKVHQQEKMAAIGTLAAGIVHEMGNPIAALVGLLENFLDQNTSLNEAEKKDLELMLEHIHRLSDVTRNVSEFYQPQPEEIQLFDLNSMVKRTVQMVNFDKRFSKINCQLNLDQNLPAINGSASQLRQVLFNLLINSADALTGVECAEIIISTEVEKDKLLLNVIDNGHGIDNKIIKQIIEPFFTTKAVGKGTGLGLSFCHNVISNHSGEMLISSIPNEKTHIKIILPLDISLL